MKTILTIHCGERLCALERTAVREIAPLPQLSRPPSLPAAVEGLLNLGGEVVVVIDLARLLDVQPDSDVDPLYRHLVVLTDDDASIALLVDRVENVRQIDDSAVMPVDPQTSVNDCISGQIELDGETVSLLDADKLFLAAERARLTDIRRAEQARLDALGAA